ncbi:L-threonylcarbamoyladenylate synthase [Rubellicoccus peritrichatus]|uniref:Threonylcarbamoyl-AMP synthase n=1 Tax=Rubellicoccus peritrichatus TaxID=3080537 RepID=A0AAQ3QRI5_9BACT|nr:L-threonylcarbamoyladenylate synthase [Puniceicoccus sp. CR14]WOO39391.1 L-threonylcarbamoyladenylate synthase [Puniceicoccus sp. CR14]
MATILRPSPESVAILVVHLSEGGIAAIPTETVYGLAADATNPDAIAKIFVAKNRPQNNPLILHCHSIEQVAEYTIGETERWYDLARQFWPGPLTLILKKNPAIPDVVTAGRDTVAVRIPASQLSREVIRKLGRPIAAPSANPSGYVSPTTAEHVEESLGDRVPYILDGGACERGIESTIISLIDPEKPMILRPGPINQSELTSALKRQVITKHVAGDESQAQDAPGLFSAHYQPTIPVILCDDPLKLKQIDKSSSALLLISKKSETVMPDVVEYLTESGNANEAATNLYSALRRLDKSGVKAIYAEVPPADQEWQGVADRLNRASSNL